MTNEQIKAMSKDEFLAWTRTIPRPPFEIRNALTEVRRVGWQHPAWGNQIMAVYRDDSGRLYREAMAPF